MLQRVSKVVVFGGGSFGTAIAAALARQKPDLVVSMWLRDEAVCAAINEQHCNPRYLAVRVVCIVIHYIHSVYRLHTRVVHVSYSFVVPSSPWHHTGVFIAPQCGCDH